MVSLVGAMALLAVLPAAGRTRIYQAGPALEGNRAPARMAFARNGVRLYVTEAAEGTVAEVDSRSKVIVRRFSSGGDRPAGIAVSPDGAEVVVTNSYSGSVGFISTATGTLRALVDLPGMPMDVAISPNGNTAFVSVSQLDQVAVIDLPSATVTGRVAVGRRPQALALTADGKTLAVANLAGGSVSVVDTAAGKEDARVRLKGVNVRGISVPASGVEAYVTVMPAFNTKVTDDPKEVWHNLIQAVSLAGPTSGTGEDQWLDFARIFGSAEVVGSPDQHDIVLNAAATHAWIAVAGRDVVTRITIHDRRRDAIWPISQVEVPVGANPRGLALSPDGAELWAANYLGNSLTVIDARNAKVAGTVDLGKASRIDPTLGGQYLYHNAGLTRLHRFSCNSCHPEGASDGLTWRFAHVKDGFVRRNSRDLRAGVVDTGPFRWSGHDTLLSEFVESEVTGLLGGPRPSDAQTAALVGAVRALRMPRNPFRQGRGQLTDAGKEGKGLFEGKAGCAGCHAGERFGGTGRKADIGTREDGRQVDVPHLTGVYDGAPYLHDGRASSLEEIFTRHNGARKHGQAHVLTSAEMELVLRYVREL